MAGTTYDKTKDVKVVGQVKPGVNPILISIDFTKLNVAAADNNWKILAVKDGWVLWDGFTRIKHASSSTATVDVGTAEDGTELDTAIDLSSQATDWTKIDTLKDGTKIIVAADGYIWLDFNTAAVSDGTLEILLFIGAAPNEDSSGIV